jgi:DNA-binding NarL/FixJ family response regulator
VSEPTGIAPLRVIVADDHPVFREGLVSALEDRGLEVVATATNGDEAVATVASERPAVVLMDLTMPGMSGLEATRVIVANHPSTAVLVLTMSDDDDSLFAALRAGAQGYLIKEADPDDIARAVATVARGGSVLGPRIGARVLDAAAKPGEQSGERHPFPQLTHGEREVLALVARGYDNLRIAGRLSLSEKTVRNRVSIILTKLPATSRAEAVAAARDAGLGSEG